MPLNPKMKAIIEADTTMSPEYKQSLMQTMENAPADFQNGWMAQSDYTRQMNEFKQQQNSWKTTADDFYNKSNQAIEGWKTEVNQYRSAADQANNRIRELEAQIASNVQTTILPGVPGVQNNDAAMREIAGLKELLKGIESKVGKVPDGVITKQELDTQLNSAYQNVVGFLGENQLVIDDLKDQYRESFGKRMDRKEVTDLINFANEKSKERGARMPLDEAFSLKYRDDMQKKHDEEVARKAVEADRTTRGVPAAGGEMPGGPGPGGPGKGPLEIRLEELRNRDSNSGKNIGYATWQEAAAAGADELSKEGKY